METEEKKIYTIDDIARELGVSKTTVSRAISGKGRIGQATRDRVLAIVENGGTLITSYWSGIADDSGRTGDYSEREGK